ncbi:MAG: VOC family protein [Cephaloticoccus sp.]
MKKKSRVTGLGGVFFKARDPQKLAGWYEKHLGLPVNPNWGCCSFAWRDPDDPEKPGSTVWSPFAADTKYLGRGQQGHMFNYRVKNLKRVLAALKQEGVWVDPKIEESEFGKFGWIKDGEGNRVELWQPPKGR